MTRRPLALTALALATLLTACKREAAPDAAAGQVLPGSISDAMLPQDRVTSQPPLDPRADRSNGGGGEQATATAAAVEATGAAAEPKADGTGAAD
jgi:hypothetical protein